MAFKRKIPINVDEEQGTTMVSEPGNDSEERDADFSLLSDEDDQAEEGNGAPELATADEVQELRKKLDDTRQSYLRALADLENFKKRATRERSELIKYQGERVFTDILDTVDNLELAVEHAEADPEKFKEGIQLIIKMFHDTLARWDVRPQSGLGQQFDPNTHAAISRMPSEDEAPGTIINELKKAYFYKDRLLRAGEVVVAVAPEVPAQEEPSETVAGTETTEGAPEGQESSLEADEEQGEKSQE
jgi:molecular chaperone GrpE